MDTSMFNLSPKLKEPLHMVMLLDNSYVFDSASLTDLKKQFEVLDQHIFQKEFRSFVHIDLIYFDGFEVKKINNQSNGSFLKCLEIFGLPKIGEALTQSLDQIESIIKKGPLIKPWLFIFHQGFKVGDIPWDRLIKLSNEKKLFFRGFILNQTIKLNAIQDGITSLPYIKLKPGKISDMLEFIFKLCQQRVGMPEDQSIKLPSKEAFALWGEPVTK
jgi:hypothetical protein